MTRDAAHIARARGALATLRQRYDREPIPRYRGELVREMHAIVRDSLSRYGDDVAAAARRDFIPGGDR